MGKQFTNGYTLLIGVNDNAVPKWSLPDIIKDIKAFRSVLIHPERCVYPEKNVRSLTGNNATRENILDGLAWLQDRIEDKRNSNATVIVYYTGHGWRDTAEGSPDYYLIPYNVREDQIRLRALRASDFAAAIKGLNSQRLLVILDCCHAGGMGVKGASFLPEGYISAALPSQLVLPAEKTVTMSDGAKGLEDLASGAGRAVISSSQGHQLSYIRKDRKMSIFTYHLIEALTGHAQPQKQKDLTQVLVTDVMSHVYRNVPKSAEADWNEAQVPDYQLSGNFPVALLLGGKGLPEGQSAPDPFSLFEQREQTVSGDQINIGKMSGGVVMPGTKVNGDFHQAGRDIRIGDQYKFIYSEKPASIALDEPTALVRYLDHIIESNRRLQLQGIRSAGQLVSIELEQVYITLTATERRTVPAEKAWLDEMAKLAPGEAKRSAWMESARSRETVTEVKIKVQEALASHRRLVVVGDPGCGKTTLLRYLALTYARDLAGKEGLVQQRLALSEQRLPILLPLRDFASHLETHYTDPSLDGPKLLLDYLRSFFANQDIALPEDFFANRLRNGNCAALLDGVDEVAELNTRHRIARMIERFTIAYPENRYVITSRIVGYTGNARLGEEYTVTKVRDFTRADIERFVGYWNLAVEHALAREDTPFARQQAVQQTNVLLQAIDGSERVRELAVNPLLLTVIALVQRYRAQLPERRTELYEEAIEVLLGKWDEAKGLETKSSMAGRELDAGDRRSLLEPIALWMMEQHAREIEADDLRSQLNHQFLKATSDPRQAEQAVDEFVRLINERSGLLTERGQGIYSFSHLTFQEHLA
ncbi:MAG: caspase family protein, partial [Desulfobacterales bacterium]